MLLGTAALIGTVVVVYGLYWPPRRPPAAWEGLLPDTCLGAFAHTLIPLLVGVLVGVCGRALLLAVGLRRAAGVADPQ